MNDLVQQNDTTTTMVLEKATVPQLQEQPIDIVQYGLCYRPIRYS